MSACLVTERGAIVLWLKVRVRDMNIWTFFMLTKDEPNSTIQFSLPEYQLKKTPTMLSTLGSLAAPSERYTTQLLMNYLREGRTYSTKFCNDHREAILAAPYFLCETADEAHEKAHEWLLTEEGMKLTISTMGTPVPDHVPTPPLENGEVVDLRDDEEDEFTCMICMDAAPSTCVRPCGHVVVCSSCSIGLRDTPDKEICVRCRTPIEMVEDLKSGAVTIIAEDFGDE
jgi:hypothetical protein